MVRVYYIISSLRSLLRVNEKERKLVPQIRKAILNRYRDGAIWFTLANAIPPLGGILLGSINLRIIGLEDYAILSLAGYFYVMALAYSDFGGYSHLLAAFTTKSPGRFGDFGNALVLKGVILSAFLAALGGWAWAYPRNDDLYALLAFSMLALVFPAMFLEWFFIARNAHFDLFKARVLMFASQLVLTLAWLASGWKSPLFVPLIGVTAAGVTSIYMARRFGIDRISRGLAAVRNASLPAMRTLIFRLAPVMVSQLTYPYFLAYSLPWYSMTASDPKDIGAFSIGYRMIMGMLALVGSFVFFNMPRSPDPRGRISIGRTVVSSALASAFLWAAGLPVMYYYYWISNTDFAMFSRTLGPFSILMIAIFCNALRIHLVGRCLVMGRYRIFLLIHVLACAPTFLLSIVAGDRFPSAWVPWFSVLPDVLATAGFMLWDRSQARAGIVTKAG